MSKISNNFFFNDFFEFLRSAVLVILSIFLEVCSNGVLEEVEKDKRKKKEKEEKREEKERRGK